MKNRKKERWKKRIKCGKYEGEKEEGGEGRRKMEERLTSERRRG